MNGKNEAEDYNKRAREHLRGTENAYRFDPQSGLYQPSREEHQQKVDITVQREHSEYGEPETSKWSEVIGAITSIGGLLVSVATLAALVGTLYFAVRQWRESHATAVASIDIANANQDSAKAARDAITQARTQFTQDQRPYLWFEGGSQMPLWREHDGVPLNGGKLSENIWIKNYGKSPAVNVHSYAYISIKQPHPEDDISWKAFTEKGTGATYPPTEHFYVTPRTTDSVDPNFISNMQLHSGEIVFSTHIKLVYHDLSGNRYEDTVCFATEGGNPIVDKTCNKQGENEERKARGLPER